MPVRFPCNACGQLLGIGTRKIGATINCPNCGGVLTVPTEEAAEILRARNKRKNGNGSLADTPLEIALPRQRAAAFADDDVEDVLAALDNLAGGQPRANPHAQRNSPASPSPRSLPQPDQQPHTVKPKTNGNAQPNNANKAPFVTRIVQANRPEQAQQPKPPHPSAQIPNPETTTAPTKSTPQQKAISNQKPLPAPTQSGGKPNLAMKANPLTKPTARATDITAWDSLTESPESQAFLEPVADSENLPPEPQFSAATEVTDYGLNLADPFASLVAAAIKPPQLPADAEFARLQVEPRLRDPLVSPVLLTTAQPPQTNPEFTAPSIAASDLVSSAPSVPIRQQSFDPPAALPKLPDGVWITHKMLFVQVGLMMGLSLLTFVLGWMAGGGFSSRPAPLEESPAPARLALLVQYQDEAKKTQPDAGALVLVWPKGSRPAERIASQGFKPGDGELPISAPARQTIDLLGGTFARVGNDGKLELSVPRGGNFSVLIVSKRAARPAAERLKDNELILLGELFGEEAPDVVGTAAYRLKSEKLTGTVALHHTFPAK